MLPSIERTEPSRTLIVPRVGPLATRSRLRFLLPWFVFGAVAVVVIGGTTLWSVALRTSAAGRAAPDAAIGTGAAPVIAPGPPSVAALPTTPAAATASTVAAFTVVRSPVQRPRADAPPAAPAAAARTSVVPPPDPAPTTLPGPTACADPSAEPPFCDAESAPALRSATGTAASKRSSTVTT